jgi:hypothetical protein
MINKNKIRNLLLIFILRLKTYAIKNSIIICGEHRSGTTWLMELFEQLPNAVINWEPLHVKNGVVPKNFIFGEAPYIAEADNTSEYITLFKKILTFQIYNKWTIRLLKFKKILKSKYVITKFVRANRLLPWIVSKFKEELAITPVLLMRHPITTCLSQLKTFKGLELVDVIKPLKADEKFSVPQGFGNERYIGYLDYINSLNTILERRIAIWCINNVELLNIENNCWVRLYYEDLYLNPLKEFTILTSKMNINASNIEHVNFNKPSFSNFKNTFSANEERQLKSSLHNLDASYRNKIQNIFDFFKLKCYIANSAYPVKSKQS